MNKLSALFLFFLITPFSTYVYAEVSPITIYGSTTVYSHLLKKYHINEPINLSGIKVQDTDITHEMYFVTNADDNRAELINVINLLKDK